MHFSKHFCENVIMAQFFFFPLTFEFLLVNHHVNFWLHRFLAYFEFRQTVSLNIWGEMFEESLLLLYYYRK